MLVTSPIDHASWWLSASNIVYVGGAVLTLAAAVHVLLEKRAVLSRKREKESFWAEASVFLAALVSVLGTIGAIHFSSEVSHLKDVALEEYKQHAQVQISQANQDAAKAISDAATANQNAEDTKKANLALQIELTKHEGQEKEAETKLAAQQQQTNQFTQGLAQQQQGMAQQMQATPSLGDAQVDAIAAMLKPFAGQNIAIHMMLDARSGRLGGRFGQAFAKAGITTNGSSNDVGLNYVGVMILVKNSTPAPHPPLADALNHAIQSVGIQPHTFADPSLKEDEVRLCIGPE